LLDLSIGLRVGLLAVVDSDIAYGVHVGVSIQSGNFSGIIGVGEGRIARATVWVDNNKELEVRIRLDAGIIINSWLFALLPIALLPAVFCFPSFMTCPFPPCIGLGTYAA
jgi:hypothetical protein